MARQKCPECVAACGDHGAGLPLWFGSWKRAKNDQKWLGETDDSFTILTECNPAILVHGGMQGIDLAAERLDQISSPDSGQDIRRGHCPHSGVSLDLFDCSLHRGQIANHEVLSECRDPSINRLVRFVVMGSRLSRDPWHP